MPTGEPTPSCVSESLRAAGRDPDLIVDFVRSVRSVKADVLRLSDDDPKSCVRALVHASLCDNPAALPKGEALEAFVSQFGSTPVLREVLSKQEGTFLGAAKSIGTHSDKVPDPTRGNGSFFAEADVAVDGYVTGLSTRDRLKIAGAGNAADSRAMALLSKRYTRGNRILTVAEDLVEGGLLKEVLLELGMSSELMEKVRSVLKQRMTGPSDEAVECETKVFILPDGNGGYTLISPVHSYQAFDSFSKRLKAVWNAHGWIPTRTHNVGGSKPQNAGILNNAYNGTHRLLVGVPPVPRRRMSADAVRSIAAAGSILGMPSAGTIEQINVVMSDARNNVEMRSKLLGLIDKAVDEVLRNVVVAMRLADEGDIDLGSIADPKERMLVDKGWHGLSKEQNVRIVDECHSRISSAVELNIEDRLMRARLEVSIARALENYDLEDAA